MEFLSRKDISLSPVVANNRMNRQRKLLGTNSYEKEVGFSIEDFLMERATQEKGSIKWLDVCCGEGNAMIEFGKRLLSRPEMPKVELIGIDLVGMFAHYQKDTIPFLHLIETSLEEWKTDRTFDLVSCIHGLHYLPDKLAAINQMVNLLKAGGYFYANLGLENIKNSQGQSLAMELKQVWKKVGWKYDSRRKILCVKGGQRIPETWTYLGASDQAGPNYTGQEVVDSFYHW